MCYHSRFTDEFNPVRLDSSAPWKAAKQCWPNGATRPQFIYIGDMP